MNKSLALFCVLCSVLAMTFGCTSSTDANSDSVTDITGTASFVDQNGTLLLDEAGATVTARGTGYTTTSDVDGRWQLKSLPSGTYQFLFSKSGYATAASYPYYLIGGGTSPLYFGGITLQKLPSHKVTNLLATNSNSTIQISGSISGLSSSSSYGSAARVFVGKSPDVSFDPSKYSTSLGFYPTDYSNPTAFSGILDTFSLRRSGIKAGTKIYVIAYGSRNDSYSSYYYTSEGYTDPATGRYLHTALSSPPSNVISLNAP